MDVIKTRASRYHTDEGCKLLKKAERSTNEISLDIALAWDLDLCSHCRETHVKANLDETWAMRIRANGY